MKQTKSRKAHKPEQPAPDKSNAAEVPTLQIEKHEQPGSLNVVTGCHEDKLSMVLLNQMLNSLQLFPNSSGIADDYREDLKKAAVIALEGIGPKTEAEGLLAVQMVACHSAAMECYRRAMLSGQTLEGREQELKFANKLTRTYAMLLEALDKHRGKGQQKVTVEHVHVYPGGQAIVGNVEAPGGGKSKTTEQCHAQALTHAPEPPLRSSFKANGKALPIASNEEWPLPDARRQGGST